MTIIIICGSSPMPRSTARVLLPVDTSCIFSVNVASIPVSTPLCYVLPHSKSPLLACPFCSVVSSSRTIESDVLNSLGELFPITAVARWSAVNWSLWSAVAAQLNDGQQGFPAYLQVAHTQTSAKIFLFKKANTYPKHYMSRIVWSVAQPGVCCNAAPRLVSFCVAT